jgi:hypothetical protein
MSMKDAKHCAGVESALKDLADRDLYLDQKVSLYYLNKMEKVMTSFLTKIKSCKIYFERKFNPNKKCDFQKPLKYQRIKQNIFVPPCKPFKEYIDDIGLCNCKETDADPCGENCDNRFGDEISSLHSI